MTLVLESVWIDTFDKMEAYLFPETAELQAS